MVTAIFKYKTLKGPLHKVPPAVKLLLFLPISVLCLLLPSFWLASGIFLMAVFSLFFGFTIREQLTDLKPAFFLVVLLYALTLTNNIVNQIFYASGSRFHITQFSILALLSPNYVFLNTALRLFLIIQLSALIFRTTSSLEINNIIRMEIISLFLVFIPEIFKTWEMINLAWKARCGRQGINKIKSLVFVLISISFKTAAAKSKALAARKP